MTPLDWIIIAAAAVLGLLALCVCCVLFMALRDLTTGKDRA